MVFFDFTRSFCPIFSKFFITRDSVKLKKTLRKTGYYWTLRWHKGVWFGMGLSVLLEVTRACSSDTPSVTQPNAHLYLIFFSIFIASVLRVSVYYTPSSGIIPYCWFCASNTRFSLKMVYIYYTETCRRDVLKYKNILNTNLHFIGTLKKFLMYKNSRNGRLY